MSPGVYGLLAVACVAVAMYAYPRTKTAEIDPFEGRGETGDPADKSVTRKVFKRLSDRLGPQLMRTRGEFAIEKLNTRLDHAGRPGHMNAERFLGNQAASAVLLSGLFVLLFLLGGQWYMIIVGAFIGWGGWEVWLRRRGRLRQERIEKDLPDFLDILSVTVRAGLGYRAALGRVAESLGGPTGEEMTTALRQMGLGVSRREAFEGLRVRSSSDSMSSFVAAQLQAEELGVPLADALNDIAEDMRRRAHQNARRHAPARRAARVAGDDDADRPRRDHPPARVDHHRVRHQRQGPARVNPRDDQRSVLERGESGAEGWLAQAARLVLGFRSTVLLLTLVFASSLDRPVVLAAAVLIAAVSSLLPLKMWDRVGPALVRHPLWLAGEVVLATLILVITGVESPFYSYTLGTAVLAGLLYGRAGAAVFGPLLAGVYLWVANVRSDVSPLPDSFQLQIGLPALYVLTAAAGAAARELMDRVATAERELTEQESTAAAERERGRLARDMHDSLAKTVHGIGFAALALSRRIEKDPTAAAAAARQLAEDAKVAAQEARDLIAGLRERQEETVLAPGPALRAETAEWSATTQIPVKLRIEDVSDLPPVAARELRWILKEALRNVTRHGKGTTRVSVSVRRLGGRVVLSVIDDGPGFEVPDDLAVLSSDRHYGVVGMRERAQVAGGDLDIESAPGEGCTISVWVPAAAPETPQRRMAPQAPEPEPEPIEVVEPASTPAKGRRRGKRSPEPERRPRRPRPEPEPEPEPSAEPARTVSGYQWQ